MEPTTPQPNPIEHRPPPPIATERATAEDAQEQRVLAESAAAGTTTPGLAEILHLNFFVILINYYLLFEKENPKSTESESVWIWDAGGGDTTPRTDPAERPPPEIAKLGGVHRGTREIRG